MYHQRLANLKDVTAIAPLWETFLKERSHHDPSILLKSNFDYQSYVKRQLPIYPTPLRNPQTQELVFNELGELVTCPVVFDEFGKVTEKQGIPIFKKPIYEMIQGKLRLKRDNQGNYLFEE